jgi:hypothetical protein
MTQTLLSTRWTSLSSRTKLQKNTYSGRHDIHAMMSKFPADGGLNPVLVEAERLNIYEQHLPKRWQDNLYAVFE